ncbi:hypothetical protein [Bosea sp. BK604]|uniref:hypothetical protein n=1 Tax=Bosea sp. BK604 TaxID=2512180 RepID=UPI0010F3B317|nr:hypothetical protein [Bosea sp. BK604]TCR60640.1 hypothetical protein EV560_116127 [Bosea sp. BK604]
MLSLTRAAAAATLLALFASASPTSAMPMTAMPITGAGDAGSLLVEVADGCGPNRYRGPGGACHRYGTGPYPGGFYEPRLAYRGNGCPPGFWRGPWGHCRDTPYHGRLPGGGWQ